MNENSPELLRFTTAGSVDDGKSTLIGRLLYDSKSIYSDQLSDIKRASERKGFSNIDFSLFTDGLKAEREQGITIDVAYRYFSTPKRKFIIADTPGHIEYTRNMVTGASTANAALILIDAVNGIVEQTIRHTILASTLQIPHLIVCINKMDLVKYDEEVFNSICKTFRSFVAKLEIKDVEFIPISALYGDNIVERSENMKWYDGSTLLYHLENLHISSDENLIDVRFPVQYVIRVDNEEFSSFRGYAGRVVSGTLKVGDSVMILPSERISEIKEIIGPSGPLNETFAKQSVTITLMDNLDIRRGDMIVRENNRPDISQELEVMLCWFDANKPLVKGGKYELRHTNNSTRCIVEKVVYRLNIDTLHRDTENADIKMNDIGRVKIKTMNPIYVDSYRRNKGTGSIILVDESTNITVAGGVVI